MSILSTFLSVVLDDFRRSEVFLEEDLGFRLDALIFGEVSKFGFELLLFCDVGTD